MTRRHLSPCVAATHEYPATQRRNRRIQRHQRLVLELPHRRDQGGRQNPPRPGHRTPADLAVGTAANGIQGRSTRRAWRQAQREGSQPADARW